MSFEHPSAIERFIETLYCYRLARPRYAKYVNELNINGDETILDFGCGGGASSKPILNKLSDKGILICLDTSKQWINKAKKRFKQHDNVIFINEDVTTADIPKESIDIITMTYVLHDISAQKQDETVKVLAEKLRKNGKIALREPTKPNHGIQPNKIHNLMQKNKLIKLHERYKKSRYFGIFKKH